MNGKTNSPELTTLCYLERVLPQHGLQYLMLHRTIKKHDVNHDKWIGVGGHVEAMESPEDCLLREVREETGLVLTSYRMRGIVTFLSGRGDYEYMFLYTADKWKLPSHVSGRPSTYTPAYPSAVGSHVADDTPGAVGNHAADGVSSSVGNHTADDTPPAGSKDFLPACDEGILEWVDVDQINSLNLWEGDKIFFRLIAADEPFFSLKLVYDGTDRLKEAILNGRGLHRDQTGVWC